MDTQHRRPDVAGLVIAAALLVLALVTLWDMSNLRLSSTYGVGPKAMPIVIGSCLVVLAIGNAILAFRGDMPERETMDWRAIALILGGFAILMVLISWGGGFIPATTILFASVSTAFGRRAILADLLIGLVLSVVVFLLFSKLLALSLPMGPIERLF